MRPIRVLMVSKFQKFQGGVESHLHDLAESLRDRGFEVRLFSSEDVEDAGIETFDIDTASTHPARAASELLWNRGVRAEFEKAIGSFKPDLVHFHSIYHQLSPSILGAFSGPTVMTLHDYKLAAPCYTLFRDGEVCTECVGKAFTSPAIRHRCVAASRAASALCSVEDLIHSSRYRRNIDRFIVPSRFALETMVRDGMKRDMMNVVPWGVKAQPPMLESSIGSQIGPKRVVFAGRLHASKGIRPMLDSWAGRDRTISAELVIAGEGEMLADVLAAAVEDPSIKYVGLLSQSETSELLSSADLALIPSLFPETMGLSALEALAIGTPILSSGRGALEDLQGPGVIQLPSMHPDVWRNELDRVLSSRNILEALKTALHKRDMTMYTSDRMTDDITAIYGELLGSNGAFTR